MPTITEPTVHQELECKFLEVKPVEIEKKLTDLGASKQFKRLFRRKVLDFPDRRLNAQAAWLRIRDEGDKVTAAFKQRQLGSSNKKDKGMTEIEVVVDDFDKMVELCMSLGLTLKFYEENWRTLYVLDDVEIAVDEWPLIPPYIEIEASSWSAVDKTATMLGFDPSTKLICSTQQVYEHYGIDENNYTILTFDKQA